MRAMLAVLAVEATPGFLSGIVQCLHKYHIAHIIENHSVASFWREQVMFCADYVLGGWYTQTKRQ